MKKILQNIILVLASLLITLAVCEFGVRLVLKPVDYLSVTTVKDPVLGHRILPGSSGHDSWGFRNPEVPQSAEIVAIGDSHTYGNAARMGDAWPSVLQRQTCTSVYNLGMGGYGPNQYFYLFENKALQLKPRIVLVGFYFGDDLDNAYCITYGLDHWNYLREGAPTGADPCVWEMNVGTKFGKKVRHWLSCHSVLYQVVVHGPVLGWLRASVQIASGSKWAENIAVLTVPEKNISEAFIPAPVLRGVDPGKATVREGLRISLKLLEEMKRRCRERSIRFLVVLIPTKETVFRKYLQGNRTVRLNDVIEEVILGEQILKGILLDSFKKSGIEYIDTTAHLQAAIERERLYTPGSSDMHPNKNGYQVIGECVARYLEKGE